MTLKAFSLTHVVYDDENPLEKLLALITLAPIFIVVSYVTLLASKRQIHIAGMFLGQLVNEALNFALKTTIKEPRPLGCGHPGYGMPSSHSQFMAYLAVYCVLWSYRRVKLDDYLWKILGNAGLCALAALVMYSRVALRYHTVNQVLVGAFVGSIFAIFWTALTAIYVDPEISKIEKW
eukprot:CAMPEP_0167778502 /NCGR_PEP_ID=MMETSP0111_2-20121227/4288_1 /TAXON_ID=91324 /ORGANISM="Lotharella globosa, Strain CCCM811" /LENGTH=177 /DNA_ID=CAMNT_0007668811 /DNA_START=50 /DNA_END=580 /DNA_ORIENTATION=-